MHLSRRAIVPAALALSLGLCVAQFRPRGGRGFFQQDSGPYVHTEGGEVVNEDTVRTARETAQHSVSLPIWTNTPAFAGDTFTFARIIFKSEPGRPAILGWINDYPDADLNLSYRLQELTSMKVDPDARVFRLTDPALLEHPFIFMSHPERMQLREEEETALRKYLQNGGALMADDFWGERDWKSFEESMSRVLPGRRWIDLPTEHPIFHCVFNIRDPKGKLQVPSMRFWRRSYDPNDPQSMPSGRRGPGSEDMHVRAWLDEKERIMILAVHNSDTGD